MVAETREQHVEGLENAVVRSKAEFHCVFQNTRGLNGLCPLRIQDTVPLGTIQLLQCSVRLSETINKKYCFEFVTPSRTFYAIAKDADDLAAWMDAIKSAIANTLEQFFEQNSQKKAAPTSNGSFLNLPKNQPSETKAQVSQNETDARDVTGETVVRVRGHI